MLNKDTVLKTIVERRHVRMAAFAVLGVCVGMLLIWRIVGVIEIQSTQPTDTPVIEVENVVTASTPTASSSVPIYIRMPSVGIEASFEEPLGLTQDREIEVPEAYTTVGWYKYGPTPGEIGPAVVLGHVDSYEGPAVFWALGQLSVGDIVEVDREDGTTMYFEVTSLEKYAQSEFPTEKVYGKIDFPGLRLITCTGTFDKGIQRYSHNLVVFAKMVQSPKE